MSILLLFHNSRVKLFNQKLPNVKLLWYESVTLDAHFVCFSNLHDMPLAFGQTIFNTYFYDECFDMADYLLKDLEKYENTENELTKNPFLIRKYCFLTYLAVIVEILHHLSVCRSEGKKRRKSGKA